MAVVIFISIVGTAKLPDLRTVIERSRRRPNPAQQDDDDMGNVGDEREEAGVEKRRVLVKGRMAGVQGGMRGFSPGKLCSSFERLFSTRVWFKAT